MIYTTLMAVIIMWRHLEESFHLNVSQLIFTNTKKLLTNSITRRVNYLRN